MYLLLSCNTKPTPIPTSPPSTTKPVDSFADSFADSQSLDMWYPDYNNDYALGKCVNDMPIPSGRLFYDSGSECCQRAYGQQASGVCLDSLPGDSIAPMSEATTGNDFISYDCGGSEGVVDSLQIDIAYDYEIYGENGEEILPELKEQMMAALAESLGCVASSRRSLETTDDQVILGFQSAEGTDMINIQGSCDESISECIPVVGHLVAYVQSDASSDSVSTTKNLILDQIKDDITTNSDSYSNLTQNIVFVSEHRNDHQRPNVAINAEETTTDQSGNLAVIIILAVLVSLVVVAIQVLLVVKKRGLRENKKVEANEESKEKSNEVSETIAETALVPFVDHEERADFAATTDNLYLESSEAQAVSNDSIQTGSLIEQPHPGESFEEYVQRMYRKDEEMKSQASYQQMLVDMYCNQKTESPVISQQTSEDQSDNLSSTDPDLNVLPAGWIALEDPNTGNIYYANEQTNETTWEIPQVNDTS